MKRPRGLAIILWLSGLLVSAAIIARTDFATDMSAFLPKSASPSQQILVDQLQHGIASRLILIGVKGAGPDPLAAVSKSMAATLRQSPRFALVSNGEGESRDRDFLWRNRYLLSPMVTPERFTVDQLRDALRRDLQLLASSMGLLVKQSLPADPTGEMLVLIDGLGSGLRPTTHDGVWFSPDLGRALLMVQTRAAGFDIDSQERSLATIRGAFEQAQESVAGAGKATLAVTGPAVFAVESRAQIKKEATRFTIIATLLVALILLAAFRSPIVLGLALLPVASGALAGVAVVSLGFGFVHGITLGFGVTLIGEAVDYAIYLFSQTSRDDGTRTTLARIWPTIRLGLLLSILGFSAMLLSGFPGFVQLGLFTITGLVVAASVARWVLPGLTPAGFTGSRMIAWVTAVPASGHFMIYVRAALGLLVAAAAVVLVFHRGGFWEDELLSMSPVPLAEQKLDETLRREMGAPDVRYLGIVTAPDDEMALRESERVGRTFSALVAQGAMAGFDAPDHYLPSKETQRARQAALPVATELRARLDEASSGLPFRGDLFRPFLADVAAAKTQPLLNRASLDATSLSLRLESLLLRRENASVAILPLRGVTDVSRVEEQVRALGQSDVMLLDLKRQSDQLLTTYMDEAKMLALLGGAAIVILLAASLRSIRRVTYVLAPLIAAVIVTTAILILSVHKLSIFNLIGLLLVVAVGSNYSLFFERQDLRTNGGERVRASVILANLCTVIAFAVISLSSTPVLHGIGLTVAIGAFLSLVFSLALTSSAPAAQLSA